MGLIIFYMARLSLPEYSSGILGTHHTGRCIVHHTLVGAYITWPHSVVLSGIRGDLIVLWFWV
jgi:hypothetical protein